MTGRYTILATLASGGMGTVYLARMAGSAGFSRLVAIKRLHPELAAQREFISMLVDEARVASQIRHVNVIDTLDLVVNDGAFSLVLEYVEGAALSTLMRSIRQAGGTIPASISLTLVRGMLRGLDAAHEARSPEGHPLHLVHRDISPQNVLVGIDGIPRIIDFGIAKAMGKMTTTRPGEVRGKFSYMAPEQLLDQPVSRQADLYAVGVVLWELLTGARLFHAEDQRALIAQVLTNQISPPSQAAPELELDPELDAIVLRALAGNGADRFPTARSFIDALAAFHHASDDEVGAWVREVAAPQLAKKDAILRDVAVNGHPSVDDLLVELAGSPPSTRSVNSNTGSNNTNPTGSAVELFTPSVITKDPNPLLFIVPIVSVGIVALAIGGVLGMRHSKQSKTTPSASASAVTGTGAPLVPEEDDPVPSATPAATLSVSAPDTPPTQSAEPSPVPVPTPVGSIKRAPIKPPAPVPSAKQTPSKPNPRHDPDLDHR